MDQLVAGQHGQHVALVLARVEAARNKPSSIRAWRPVHTASNPRAMARSRTAANLIFSLQQPYGLGCSPSDVDLT